jgi:uncharacterized membrane protein YjfL (UPF0719 family)
MKNKFKKISISAALLTIAFSVNIFAAVTPFSDLNDIAAKDKILALQQKGYIKGVGDCIFAPNETITAAQGVQLIVNALGLNLDTVRFIKEPKATDYFVKADNEAWYANAFIIASVNGLELSAELDPSKEWTVEEFTYQLIKGMEKHNNLPMIKIAPTIIVDDNQLEVAYSGAIQRALIYGIVKLDAEGKFKPKGNMTRAAAAEQIYNALEYLKAHTAPVIDTAIVYENTQYGFNFYLPDSWKGYTIVKDKWDGFALGKLQSDKPDETGPLMYIRHPEWKSDAKRQDIPIMIFTVEQWNSLQQEKFHIGAAPMGPSELARNDQFVFALPARYNYAFLTGYEEVENILKNNSLQPTEK